MLPPPHLFMRNMTSFLAHCITFTKTAVSIHILLGRKLKTRKTMTKKQTKGMGKQTYRDETLETSPVSPSDFSLAMFAFAKCHAMFDVCGVLCIGR